MGNLPAQVAIRFSHSVENPTSASLRTKKTPTRNPIATPILRPATQRTSSKKTASTTKVLKMTTSKSARLSEKPEAAAFYLREEEQEEEEDSGVYLDEGEEVEDDLDDDLDLDANYDSDDDYEEDDYEEFEEPVADLFAPAPKAKSSISDFDEEWEDEPVTSSQETGEWLEEERYAHSQTPPSSQPWPVGLIVVAVIALLLLTAGGYGVMQQRSATQEEIRQLRAALATAASPEDVSASRSALQDEKKRANSLAEQVETLRLENRRLADTVNGLEAQLDAQSLAAAQATKAAATKPVSKPAPAKAVPVKPAPATATTGNWFVNFGSYGQSDIAQQWVQKLQPGAGKVITAPGSRDGKTFYRVRVVNLASRESAEKIARKLEREYGLPKLWIGQAD